MANNFDLRKFLTENKLTSNAKRLSENDNEMFLDGVFDSLNDQMRLNRILDKDFKAAKKYLEKHKIELLEKFKDPEEAAEHIMDIVRAADTGPEYLEEYDNESTGEKEIEYMVDIKEEPGTKKIGNVDQYIRTTQAMGKLPVTITFKDRKEVNKVKSSGVKDDFGRPFPGM